MRDGFHADHERLAARAADFGGLADQASAISRELFAVLDSLGRSFGDDDIGQSFAGVYDEPSGRTRAGIAALPGKLGDVGTRLTGMAARYRDVDRNSAGGIDRAGA